MYKDLTGVPLELRNALQNTFRRLTEAAQGDMVLVCTPATRTTSAAVVNAATAYDLDVEVSLQNAAGDIHDWYNGAFAVAGSEVTAGDGTADTTALTVTLKDGKGTATLRYIGTWAAADTATLTVTGDTLFGTVVAAATCVDTLVA